MNKFFAIHDLGLKRLEKAKQIILFRGGKLHKVIARAGSFSTVELDGLADAVGAAVVQQEVLSTLGDGR